MNRRLYRAHVCNSSATLVQQNAWVMETPYDVRDGAIDEFIKNLKTELGKRVKNPAHKFTLSKKSRYDSSMSIGVLKKSWNNGDWYKRHLKTSIKSNEVLPYQLDADSRLMKTRYHSFFLCVVSTETLPQRTQDMQSVIALDPGVRTFMTGYDPTGKVIEIARDDGDTLFNMCKQVDHIMKRVGAAKNHKQRYNRKRAAQRARDKIKQRISDLHRKTAKFLCESYNTIILPPFETSRMVTRAQRKIRSKTARSMLTFSHYAFRQRLLFKQRCYTNTRVLIASERHTTKTCTRCGELNETIGGSKVFKCKACSLVIDRDIGASRNILLRTIEVGSADLRGLPPVVS